MDKKICLIVAANSGIGKAAAPQIVQQGYHTIFACRDLESRKTALQEIERSSQNVLVELMIVDMSLQSSIREFSKNFCRRHKRLDVLIHNAVVF